MPFQEINLSAVPDFAPRKPKKKNGFILNNRFLDYGKHIKILKKNLAQNIGGKNNLQFLLPCGQMMNFV